jgi:membrane associated rhomboid family serine protease
MIPVRDSIRSRRFPLITVTIIALNIAVFIHQSNLTPGALRLFFLRHGIVPVQFMMLPRFLFSGRLDVVYHLLGTLVTGMFIHGNLVHLLGNMLYLWVFGDNIEDRLGRVRFVVFYLLAGSLATLAHIATDPASTVPLVGASGAIAGILGAYFITFPGSRVLALVPLFFFLHLAEVPAIFFLLFWFVLQLISGIGALAPGSADVVAWWAHIGGFAAGIILVRLMGPRRRPPPRYDDWGGRGPNVV